MNIESYIGAPVASKNKSRISSILVLLDDKPMKDKEFFSTVTEFLALRASAEIEKIHIEERLKEEVEKRTKELEAANKEILLLNQSLGLERSERKFKILFEHSPVGMAMIDQETGSFLEVNQLLLETTQYTKDEFLSLSFKDIIQREYGNEENKQLKDLNKIGSFGPYEKKSIKKDGSTYPVKISGFSIVNTDGKRVIWGLVEDITITKQYETIYEDNKYLLEHIAIENNLQKILDEIVLLAEQRSPESKCSIQLLDKSQKHLFHYSSLSLPEFFIQANKIIKLGEKIGSCGSAAYKKQRVVVENIDTHENWQKYLKVTKKANLHACWSEPIMSSNNQVLGTFAIYNTKPKKPSEFEIKLIENYANLSSKAIEKYNYTKQIKDNENKLEQLFNNSQSGLLYIDENKKIIQANQRFADILGYDAPDEIIGFNMEGFEGKDSISLITNTKNSNIEYQLKKKNGDLIWCGFSGKALDKNTSVDLSKGVLWTINDISLRKKYEEEIKEKQILLKNILSTIPDMIWLKDKEGVYKLCNPEFEKFFGKKEIDIIGKTDYDFVDKELADFFREHDKNAMNTTKTLINEEWVTYASNKKRVLLDTSKKAMQDEEGNIIGVLGIGHDVTQRKRREDELKNVNDLAKELTKSQEVLLSLFDKGDSILFRWKNNAQWNVEYVSKSVEKFMGIKEEEFLSNKIVYSDCIHPDDIQRVEDEVENALAEDLNYFKHEPYRIITKSGEEKWILDHTATQKDENNNITYFIGYITDISEQVKNQEMMYHQAKIASLGEMLGNIAHQWRQPLSLISTSATGTKLKKELGLLNDIELIENMDNINETSQYLSKTIDDFRNFFSIDDSSNVEVSLEKVIEKSISLIKDSFKSSNVKIIKDYNLSSDLFVCNENLFLQALINILNNANDALSSREDKSLEKYVFINLKKEENSISLKIKDNAGGIPENIIDKIFDPYFTTKHQSQGTGIGLYMTNQIITKHLKSEVIVENSTYVYKDKEYTGASFNLILKEL
jgi:PAS domain S-box-containing protein